MNTSPPVVATSPGFRPVKPGTPVKSVLVPVSTVTVGTPFNVNKPFRPVNVKLSLPALSVPTVPENCEGTSNTLFVVSVPGVDPLPAVNPVEFSNTD